MKNRLVQLATPDGLYIHGYHSPSSDKKYVVLHIHGSEGNFYENNFVHVIAKELENSNIGFLTVNTRGNGKDTEFNTVNGDYRSPLYKDTTDSNKRLIVCSNEDEAIDKYRTLMNASIKESKRRMEKAIKIHDYLEEQLEKMHH